MSSALIAASAVTTQARINYPDTRRVDTVDTYFGTQVPDPYRWLEDDNSPETEAWVAAQNKVTQNYLSKISFRKDVKKRITELANYEKMGAPFKVKDKFYFFKNNGLQNQSVLYEYDKNGKHKMVLDPNTLSEDGTVALQQLDFSNDGRYLAYVITRSGSDWNEIFVKDLKEDKVLDDHIVWAKFTDAQWLGDGFFYSGYDAPEDAKSSKNEFQKVYYHKLGTPQSQDYIEYQDKSEPLHFHQVSVSEDERYVILWKSDAEGNDIYVKDLKDRNPHYVQLIGGMKYERGIIGIDNGKIYVMTNENAPKGKIITYDAETLSPASCAEFIPEQESVLTGAVMADHKFILTYDKDASSHPYLYDQQGKLIREIQLPTYGSVGFSCKKTAKEVFYSFASYTFPGAIYKYDLETGKSELFFQPKVNLKSEDYVTEQVFFNSKDGARIPMFLVYKKGLKRDGQRPTFLYGYGGFNVSLNPAFTYTRTLFAMLDCGGICAYVNLRGGGEYGEEWHQAGTKMNKQNVFDDFIAAAEWLIDNKYTNPKKLACNGASNGGLLVGAVVNQRPDLFAAAVPQVGVMDMLRYHEFTIGWNWAPDYGRSDDSPEMFNYLRGYSPLHNIKNDGTRYPAIMVTLQHRRPAQAHPHRQQGWPRPQQAHQQDHRRVHRYPGLHHVQPGRQVQVQKVNTHPLSKQGGPAGLALFTKF